MLKAAIANYLGFMIIIKMIMLHKTVNTDKKKKKLKVEMNSIPS